MVAHLNSMLPSENSLGKSHSWRKMAGEVQPGEACKEGTRFAIAK